MVGVEWIISLMASLTVRLLLSSYRILLIIHGEKFHIFHGLLHDCKSFGIFLHLNTLRAYVTAKVFLGMKVKDVTQQNLFTGNKNNM